MSKDVLRAIAGIGIFPIVSLVLFVTVFVLTSVWALRMDRQAVEALAALPLDADGGPIVAPVSQALSLEGGSRGA